MLGVIKKLPSSRHISHTGCIGNAAPLKLTVGACVRRRTTWPTRRRKSQGRLPVLIWGQGCGAHIEKAQLGKEETIKSGKISENGEKGKWKAMRIVWVHLRSRDSRSKFSAFIQLYEFNSELSWVRLQNAYPSANKEAHFFAPGAGCP